MQVHTDARQFMTRPIPYYKDLCVICESSIDERDCHFGQDLAQPNKSHGALDGIHSPNTSVFSEDLVGDVLGLAHTCQKDKRHRDKFSNLAHSKRLRTGDEGMAGVLREMTTDVSLSVKMSDENSSISIESVIEAVQALPEMDEDLVLDACDFLEDEKKAKTFMALDVKLRRKWLLRKLRPQTQLAV